MQRMVECSNQSGWGSLGGELKETGTKSEGLLSKHTLHFLYCLSLLCHRGGGSQSQLTLVHPGLVASQSQKWHREKTIHSSIHTLTGNLESPVDLHSLERGRKPEYLERTHAGRGRTSKLHTHKAPSHRWVWPQNLLAVRQQCQPPPHCTSLSQTTVFLCLYIKITRFLQVNNTTVILWWAWCVPHWDKHLGQELI